MTLDEYIKNPMGKDNAVLNATTRELIRAQYSAKFDNILLIYFLVLLLYLYLVFLILLKIVLYSL